MGKQVSDANTYRAGHPLAQRVLEQAKALSTPTSELTFQYSRSGKHVASLEPLVGKSGWLMCSHYSVRALESEDYLVLSGFTEDGTTLDEKQIQRFFDLPASTGSIVSVPQEIETKLLEIQTLRQNALLEDLAQRNADWFEIEIDKLDRWAQDRRTSLKVELDELDEAIKETRPGLIRWGGSVCDPGEYRWKNGIGDRDLRTPFPNKVWGRIDSNDVGIDEFCTFCDLVDAEPLVCLSFSDGPQSAADLVEYCNGTDATPWGARRAANGRRQPYRVKYWQVGNEISGDNDDYLEGRTREQDPIYSVQGGVIYGFGRGKWVALHGNYYTGGRTSVDGVEGDDLQRNSLLRVTAAWPLNRRDSLKFFVGTGVSTRTGTDFDTVSVAWQRRWGGGL